MDSFSLDAVRIESIFFFSLGLGLLVGMKVGYCVGMSFKAFSNFNAPGLKKPEMPLLNVTAINSGLLAVSGIVRLLECDELKITTFLFFFGNVRNKHYLIFVIESK